MPGGIAKITNDVKLGVRECLRCGDLSCRSVTKIITGGVVGTQFLVGTAALAVAIYFYATSQWPTAGILTGVGVAFYLCGFHIIYLQFANGLSDSTRDLQDAGARLKEEAIDIKQTAVKIDTTKTDWQKIIEENRVNTEGLKLDLKIITGKYNDSVVKGEATEKKLEELSLLYEKTKGSLVQLSSYLENITSTNKLLGKNVSELSKQTILLDNNKIDFDKQVIRTNKASEFLIKENTDLTLLLQGLSTQTSVIQSSLIFYKESLESLQKDSKQIDISDDKFRDATKTIKDDILPDINKAIIDLRDIDKEISKLEAKELDKTKK